jgi:hypothetical protein
MMRFWIVVFYSNSSFDFFISVNSLKNYSKSQENHKWKFNFVGLHISRSTYLCFRTFYSYELIIEKHKSKATTKKFYNITYYMFTM